MANQLSGTEIFKQLGLGNLGNLSNITVIIFEILFPLTLFILLVWFIFKLFRYDIHINISSKVGMLGEKGFIKFDKGKFTKDRKSGTPFIYLKKLKRKIPMPPRSCFIPVRNIFAKWRLDLEQLNELDFVALEPPNLKHPNNYKEIDLRMLQWWLAESKSTREKFTKRNKLEAYIPAISMIIALLIVGVFIWLMVGMLTDGLNNIAGQMAALKSQAVQST